jgi:hypothetical protein
MLALLLASLSVFAKPTKEDALKWRMKIVEMGLPAVTDDKEARPVGVMENFLQSSFETSLSNMESRRLFKGAVKTQPWSGHYWPNYSGGLAFRWADPRFPQTDNWGRGERYFRSQSGVSTYFNVLSPAEKYDYMTSSGPYSPGSLSQHQWNLGRDEFSRTGSVATWQGICHGWAPASIYMPKPIHNVSFRFPEGEFVLTTDDVKALGSLYWANGTYETLHAGFRCNAETVSTNREGRVVDPNCFDVNPADWHIALTHMVGVKKESFIIDAEENSQVWNHPVVSYEMEFFDPAKSSVRSKSFRDVVRDFSRSNSIPHRTFRSPNTKFVVGVVSRIQINVETMPGVTEDVNDERVYVYDLELDANYNVVGGEWRDQARPDFLWRVRPGVRPSLPGDSIPLDMWSMRDANWRRAAQLNNAKGAPIKLLVEELFRLTQ